MRPQARTIAAPVDTDLEIGHALRALNPLSGLA
jgi:hypothetical protein